MSLKSYFFLQKLSTCLYRYSTKYNTDDLMSIMQTLYFLTH